ncbi:Opioid-binding protein/cell adhesion molecule homolog [Clonorchis sinensis]|uniref:Opioid-binding protein/cell adhesion molecule homolog n=1 Tax=Clonorchis sinensis TaxID=79923 RepID=H2KUX2_CLOSI|nr:Opioid-binding protein/cell adhesion molecule homolog [Clonorchis sinensis]
MLSVWFTFKTLVFLFAFDTIGITYSQVEPEGAQISNSEPADLIWPKQPEVDIGSSDPKEEGTLEKDTENKQFDAEDFASIIVEAVVNNTALLPCRPIKKSAEGVGWDATNKGTLLWKRASTNDYLIHDNRRLHPDTRFILDMSSFDQTIMDLRIDNVQQADEGTYICLYSTGQHVYKRKIRLNVLVPPIIYENSSSPTRVVVQEGDDTVLHCKAWGVPQPNVTWYLLGQDGSSIQLGRLVNSPRFTVEANHLQIFNVTRTMNGLYKCVAQNGLERMASRVIELDVHFPPTIRMANTKIGQLLYRTTMVRALITGNPINRFHWEFEQRPIYGPNSNCLVPMPNEKYCMIVDTMGSLQKELKTTLFITNLTMHDYGLYTCVVETPYGIFRNSTEVFRTYPSHGFPWENQFIRPLTQSSNSRSSAPKSDGPVGKSGEQIDKRETYLTASSPWRTKENGRMRPYFSSKPPCQTPSCNNRATVLFISHDWLTGAIQLVLFSFTYVLT